MVLKVGRDEGGSSDLLILGVVGIGTDPHIGKFCLLQALQPNFALEFHIVFPLSSQTLLKHD